MVKNILSWKSKVQYRKCTPYLSLIKHLSNIYTLQKGSEVECKLVMIENKLKVIIDLE